MRANIAGLVLILQVVVPAAIAEARQAPATALRPTERTLTESSVTRIARLRLPSIVLVHASDNAPESVATFSPGGAFGSGVIIDRSGLIVTNAHVVAGMTEVHVTTANGEELPARLLGQDPLTDLALLQVTFPSPLPAVVLGRSATLAPGQFVVALGNPIELHHSVTLGVVSALDRTLDDDGLEFIQTDASINPGSSGGALFDLRGTLVGITSGMLSRIGEDAGLNFAIPVDVVRDLLPSLRAGRVVHGWIGATLVPLPDASTGGLHGAPGPTSLRVAAVTPESPAARAGLTRGDVVTAIVGKPPSRAREILRAIRLAAPGTAVALRIRRGAETSVVKVEVESNPASEGSR